MKDMARAMPMTMTPRMVFPDRTTSPMASSAPVLYQPVERGFERELKKRLDWFTKQRLERGS